MQAPNIFDILMLLTEADDDRMLIQLEELQNKNTINLEFVDFKIEKIMKNNADIFIQKIDNFHTFDKKLQEMPKITEKLKEKIYNIKKEYTKNMVIIHMQRKINNYNKILSYLEIYSKIVAMNKIVDDNL